MAGFLTRAQVAGQLGVSVSTVRRFEGDRLHPKKDRDGVNMFDPGEVRALAAELKRAPKADPDARTGDLTRGEITARAFERFERRETLAEVVIGLRLTVEETRDLYHQWLIGLAQGELKRSKPAPLPTGSHVSHEELVKRLAALPRDVAVRITVAKDQGEHYIDDTTSTRDLEELGGFITHGPLTPADLRERYRTIYRGRSCRVTAYRLAPPALLWEVMAPLESLD